MRKLFALALVCNGALLAACPSTSPAPQTPTTAASDSSGAPVKPPLGAVETPASTSASSASPNVTPTPLDGKAVKSPVFSGDSCNQDAECAPVATCHSKECVALANAGTM